MQKNDVLNSKNSGRKPSNVVDVCGPKSGDPEDFNDACRQSVSEGVERDVIDEMYSAVLSQNESQEQINALRPRVEEAVRELIAERGLPRNWTGVLEYHGFKIRVQRPTSYTWEQNNQIHDDNLDYYKQQHALYLQLNRDAKQLRADMKRTAERLADSYPDSESIKHGFTIAVIPA